MSYNGKNVQLVDNQYIKIYINILCFHFSSYLYYTKQKQKDMNKHSHILFRVGNRPDVRVTEILRQYHTGNMKPSFMPGGPFLITAFTMDQNKVEELSLKISELGHQFMILPIAGSGVSETFELFFTNQPIAQNIGRVVGGRSSHTPTQTEATPEAKIAKLRESLRLAVESDNFERAGELRDEINRLTGEAEAGEQNES